jgi:5-methylcytosine-specific restriction endonuclease McrA
MPKEPSTLSEQGCKPVFSGALRAAPLPGPTWRYSMSFSEALKAQVKDRAHFTCCYCRDRQAKVDVHHIVPEAQGGPDTLDNAAPLCGSCHDRYGGNPDLRKEIRGRRDQ